MNANAACVLPQQSQTLLWFKSFWSSRGREVLRTLWLGWASALTSWGRGLLIGDVGVQTWYEPWMIQGSLTCELVCYFCPRPPIGYTWQCVTEDTEKIKFGTHIIMKIDASQTEAKMRDMTGVKAHRHRLSSIQDLPVRQALICPLFSLSTSTGQESV